VTDPEASSPAAPASVPFWLSPCSYWHPAHFTISAWVTHAPFAFWLMDVLRPTSVVELGTHYGYSCFVFAEAAKRLGLDCRIAALDSWLGDDQAGIYGEDVYESVVSTIEGDYADLVRPIRGYFDESRSLIPDRSVDLLHIDGRHGYDDVLADFTSWRTAVRDGGVVLFHDTAERQPGFGVWRLWEELAAEHPTFEFEHGHGLGVLAIGDVRAAPLAALFEADDETARRIRADYEALGDVIYHESWLTTLPTSSSWRVTEPLRRLRVQLTRWGF